MGAISSPRDDEEWSSLIQSTSQNPSIASLLPEGQSSTTEPTPAQPYPILSVEQVAALIDHTLLKPEARAPELVRLCEEAVQNGFRTVCIEPHRIDLCNETFRNLKPDGVTSSTLPDIAAVIGFPEGNHLTQTKCAQAQKAVQEGAAELDMVLNYEQLLTGRYHLVFEDIKAVRDSIDKPFSTKQQQHHHHVDTSEMQQGERQNDPEINRHITLKVILETSQLTPEQIVAGCLIAIRAGADFVKTSTGFRGRGATIHDVRLMKAVCVVEHERNAEGTSRRVKVKASGGVRTLDDCLRMVDAGAERIGASAGVQILGGLRALKAGTNTSAKSDVPQIDHGTY